MKPRDIFHIIVTTGGLVCFILGLVKIVSGVAAGIALPNSGGGIILVSGLAELVIGVLIMKGIIPLTDMAFPADASQSKDSDKSHDAA
jgi:hypothetical protein